MSVNRYDPATDTLIPVSGTNNHLKDEMVAEYESTSTATHAYEVGGQFIYNGKLYEATSAIPIGGTIITEGANANCVESDSLTEQIAKKGGGGGGGHTIVNESGTELAQRSKLQFIGASVTDDETNDTTVVEVENDVNLDIIAPTEVSPSTHAYEVGEQFIYNDNLYTATSNIAVGDSIVPEGSTPTVVGAITLYEQATTHTGITKVVIDDVEYTTFSNMPVKEGSHVVFYHDSSRGWYFDPYDSSTYVGNRNLGVGEACYFDVPEGISGTLTLYVYPFTNNNITYDTLSLEPSQGWGEKKEEVIPALGEGTPISRGNCILSDAIVDQLDQSITISYADYQQLTPEEQANGDYYIPDYPSQPGYADNAPRAGSQAYVTSDGLNNIIGTADISSVGTTIKGAIANLGSATHYSTTEQWTGKYWIDGKKIYQKTILKGEGFTKGTWNAVAHGITNLDEVHFAEGILKITQNESTYYHQLGGFRDANYCSELQIQPTAIQVYIGNTEENITINKYEVTVQYTKTTD